jgi:hypothetical protein
VHGTLDMSGRGPREGRGGGISGSGGSYGGSGGMLTGTCGASDAYFAVYHSQIGGLDVAEDVSVDPAEGGFGSGGGVAGSGHGGGRIVLDGRTVDIAGGHLLAAGAKSLRVSAGSGSGGGVSVTASNTLLSSSAVIKVAGGNAERSQNIPGGSGGRVTVRAPEAMDPSLLLSLHGGSDAAIGPEEQSCLIGASGTMLWLRPALSSSALFTRNSAYAGQSVTLLTEASILDGLAETFIDHGAVVAMVGMESPGNAVEISRKGALVGYYSALRPPLTNETDSKLSSYSYFYLLPHRYYSC